MNTTIRLATIDDTPEIANLLKFPFVDMTKILTHNKKFQGKNPGDYGDLSTLTVPQFVRLGIKILLGSSQ